MKPLSSSEIRKKFLDFFKKNGHEIVKSSSLVPCQDPTLIFANAGMNQFKDLFLGTETRSYKKAASSQKCVRAGGKHNDLDEVGFTDRHLTFFEMLGNFSFGDYFKREAIFLAWKFLTKELEIPEEKLLITVHKSDQEAFNIWKDEVKVPENKIQKLSDEDNFWQMGDTGPCGPCSEIFFDRGPEKEPLEIWNLVFMEFEKTSDGKTKNLSQKGVDTGMGFERLSMVMQNGPDLTGDVGIYNSDIFSKIISKIEEMVGKNYSSSSKSVQAAFHVIADHSRSSTMLISDGVTPSNDGRGYVLRKIIRRGLLFLKKLTKNLSLFSEVSKVVLEQMKEAYPELEENKNLILEILNLETERFSDNLNRGQGIFEKYLQESEKEKVISGKQIFKLYDTYGFPVEVTKIMAQEAGFKADLEGFEKEMQKQKESSKKTKGKKLSFELKENGSTEFTGYSQIRTKSKITWSQSIDDSFWISTEKSPFFAECGGQVSDSGKISASGKEFKVLDVKRVSTGKNTEMILLCIENPNLCILKEGVEVELSVDPEIRANTAKNHTGTHLLQAALKKVLGNHAEQAGSLVHPDYLRFSFTHNKAMSRREIEDVEKILNRWIFQNHPTGATFTTLEEANKMGAMALFGEKYNPEKVRVITISDFSAELCGGTHLSSTGQVGPFKIVSEDSLGVGIRVINAVTGPKAVELMQENFKVTKSLSEKFAVKSSQVLESVEKLESNLKEKEKQIKALKKEIIKSKIPVFEKEAELVGDIKLFFAELKDFDSQAVKMVYEEILNKNPEGACFVLNSSEKRDNFAFVLGKNAQEKINLKNILKDLKNFGLSGGGREGSIQGGGSLSSGKKELKEFLKKFISA